MIKIKVPTQCPSCGSTLERVKDQLFCNNKTCEAVVHKKVLGYIKKLKILGLGEKTVEKLHINDIHDIYTLDIKNITDIIGEKLATKLINNINNTKTVTIGKLLSAFSIPLIGETAAGKISSKSIDDITYDSLRSDGLGEKATYNLIDWLTNEWNYYADLPLIIKPNNLQQAELTTEFVVCITGRIPGYTKATLTKELENLGVKVSNSITNNVTHLICNDRKGSSKEKKAEELEIPIIKYDEFKEILNVKK